jgi:hypothetical protein
MANLALVGGADNRTAARKEISQETDAGAILSARMFPADADMLGETCGLL